MAPGAAGRGVSSWYGVDGRYSLERLRLGLRASRGGDNSIPTGLNIIRPRIVLLPVSNRP